MSLSSVTISGKRAPIPVRFSHSRNILLTLCDRLLDKIAKQILVCENKSIKPWDGSIGAYKNYLRKKMLAAGAV